MDGFTDGTDALTEQWKNGMLVMREECIIKLIVIVFEWSDRVSEQHQCQSLIVRQEVFPTWMASK